MSDDYTTTSDLPKDLTLHDDFGDLESMWNSRKWLKSALEKSGAKVVGGGMGMGAADLDIKLEGFKFNVTIRAM